MGILTCAYCEVDQPELKDFANAFCKVDLNENCDTSKVLNPYEELSVSVFTDEQDDQAVNISWTTSKLNFFKWSLVNFLVIESEELSITEIAERIVDNFENVDEIIDEDSRTIPNNAMESISQILNDTSKIEDNTEEDNESLIESTTPSLPELTLTPASTGTENDGLDTREILLISFGSFFEALFIGATVYFFTMDKKTSGLIGCAVSVLIRKLNFAT